MVIMSYIPGLVPVVPTVTGVDTKNKYGTAERLS